MSTIKETVGAEGRSEKSRFHGEGYRILELIDFQLDAISGHGVHGRFRVGDNSMQPFGVLYGGVTAYITESIASMGAKLASNFQRIAGIQLNINHLRSAPVGCEVKADAVPLMVGKRLQVWEVKFSTNELVDKKKPLSDVEKSETLLAVARLTVIVGLPKTKADDSAAVTGRSARL